MIKADWKDKWILIAEDDYYSFIFLREMLAATGVNIVHADNGIKAFAECMKNPEISVVLMDIKMPVVNGLESTRLIKKYKPNIRVIAQTAFAMQEDHERCIEAGCDDYLSKPVISENLVAMLQKHLFQEYEISRLT